MITQAQELLKAARDALAAAGTVGYSEDFEEYQARILLGEIKEWTTKLDPDWDRQQTRAKQ